LLDACFKENIDTDEFTLKLPSFGRFTVRRLVLAIIQSVDSRLNAQRT
jgi:hypothetical protein